ncbi:MAG: RnfH family protein [Betaproteobacteria bacterium]|nr:RnfH family protein [Betaproteobacteria bacterium]MDH5221278.1 RnfH family protein [Betaproteobacteria bacterium]MDH5350319.1 RnfH family protein [Betaproteobacteria bacterium]
MRVEVVRAWPDRAELRALELEEGATVRAALVAAGMAAPHGAGIHGRRVPMDAVLADGDRVEVYRPLLADPKAARRRRARDRKRRCP